MATACRANLEVTYVAPVTIGVGTELPLTIRVSCPCGCDLQGALVKVLGPGGEFVSKELTRYTNKSAETEVLGLPAPEEVGQHTWNIVFPRQEFKDVVHDEHSLVMPFRTIPHATTLAVWNVPTAPIAMGSTFTVRVGVKCSEACRLTGGLVEIRDSAGTIVGSDGWATHHGAGPLSSVGQTLRSAPQQWRVSFLGLPPSQRQS